MIIKEKVESLCRRHDTRNPFDLCRSLGIIVLFEPLGTVRGYYSQSHRFKTRTSLRSASSLPARMSWATPLCTPKPTPRFCASTLYFPSTSWRLRLTDSLSAFAIQLHILAESLQAAPSAKLRMPCSSLSN